METDRHREAIERELEMLRELAGAPRESRLGCTLVSHDKLGYCSACEPSSDGRYAVPLELLGWRLLALREAAR